MDFELQSSSSSSSSVSLKQSDLESIVLDDKIIDDLLDDLITDVAKQCLCSPTCLTDTIVETYDTVTRFFCTNEGQQEQ